MTVVFLELRHSVPRATTQCSSSDDDSGVPRSTATVVFLDLRQQWCSSSYNDSDVPQTTTTVVFLAVVLQDNLTMTLNGEKMMLELG
jgi:hypothetical protein